MNTWFSHIVHLLLQPGLCLGEHVDFVLLGLEVVQNLLVSFQQGGFLSAQSRDGFIQNRHLLGQILHLDGEENSSAPPSSTTDVLTGLT